MTRAKRKYGSRQTKFVPAREKRAFADGRPKGTRKKFPFEQTPLGFLLKYEMPVVYDILQDKYKDPRRFHPAAEVVELVCRASGDPTYKKPKFRRCMNAYIADGLCCKRGKILTEGRRVYYESVRRKKMEAFIAGNRKKIKILEEQVFNNVFKKDSASDA
jgi:hypothetical protein